MLLLCYDGSDDAKTAIDTAADLLPASEITVLTVWEPFSVFIARASIGPGYATAVPNIADLDQHSEEAAHERAKEGADRASAAGLVAAPIVARFTTSIADTIIAEAARLDVKAIVVGTRGLGSVKSALFGSVSHAILHHADRTVIVARSQ